MREKLMNTAIKLWKEQGYDNVSIPMICKECGVTKGSFYHYYKSKDDVLLSYFKVAEKPMLVDLLVAIVVEPRYIEKIWLFMEFYTKMAIDLGPELIMILIQSDMKQRKQILPLAVLEDNNGTDDSYYNILLSIFKEGQKCGEIRQGKSVEKLMEMIEAAFTGLLLSWGATGQKFNLLERQKELLEMLLEPSDSD